MFRFFTRFPFPIRAGGPPYTSGHPYASAALRQFTKNRKAHTSQATHCSPCLADPHAPRIPIRATFPHVSTAPQCNLQAPKIPTLVSARPASPAPQTTPAGLHKFPASTAGAVPHAQAGHRPAETSVSGTANQAPTGLHKLPAAATTCSPPTASTHGAAPRRGVDAVGARIIGPKGPITVGLQARH